VISEWAGLPPRIVTSHGTVLFVDPASGELRHGPPDRSPVNARLISDGSHGRIVHEVAGSLLPVSCGATSSRAIDAIKDADAAAHPTVFAVVSMDPPRIGLKAEGLFLCAERDGRVTLSRPECAALESFVISEPPLTHDRNIFHYSNDLIHLALKHRVDKWASHWYVQHYHRHFAPFRYQKINLLEIGVGGYQHSAEGGGSLRMWEEYFPYADIYGIDIYDKSAHQRGRIRIRQGSQDDERFLDSLFREAGSFDIIIDDGSHINSDVIKSFSILFPYLSVNGIYAVEDVQTSYWPHFGGDSIDLNNRGNIVGFFKHLVDSLNYEELMIPEYRPSYFDKHIIAMHFYHNLIIIKKWLNDEGSTFLSNNVAPAERLKRAQSHQRRTARQAQLAGATAGAALWKFVSNGLRRTSRS